MPHKISVLISGNNNNTTELKGAIKENDLKLTIKTVDSGKKALETASGKMYDVIVSFFNLSDMKGTELCQQLSKYKINTPFILIFDTGDERELLDALSKGPEFYVQELKPPEILSLELAAKVTTVTERKKEERQPCESESWAVAYFRESPEGIFVTDGSGHFLDVNPSACNMSGYTREELLTMSFPDTLDTSSLESGMGIFKECRTLGHAKGELLYTHKNGSLSVMSVIMAQSGPDEFVVIIRDITQSRKTLEALKENEERYRNLLEGVPDYILVHRNGKILYANQAALNITGLKKDELIGLDLIDFVAPESQKSVLTMMKERAKGEIIPIYEIIVNTKLGPRIAEVHGSKISYEGKPASIVVLTDITERKEVEQQLQKSREQYKSLIEDISEIVYRVDTHGNVIYASPATQSVLGMKPEELIGKNIFEFIHPDDVKKMKDSFMEQFKGSFESWTFRSLDSEGGIHYLRASVHTITENNTITGMTGIISDFTRETLAKEELLESEQRFRSLFENSPFAYQSLDNEGMFIDINSEWTKLTGYSREEVIGTFFEDYWPKESYQHCRDQFFDFLEKGDITAELILVTKDKTMKTVLLNGRIQRDGEGRFVRTHCILNDISERKRAEEAIKGANKKLNLLSSITRHDIINQISAAQMFVDVMEMEGNIPPDSKTAEDLKIVGEALKTIERQIVFTRDYQDLGVHSPEWFNVGTIVSGTVSGAYDTLIVDNQVQNVEVYADPLFEKVIYNLFDNAVRHGETITTIRFTSEETPEGFKLICEDDGVGVPADVKEKIFNRQYYQHTGLGLFLTREILSITGMTIAETGTEGKGARFEISVPEGMWRLT